MADEYYNLDGRRIWKIERVENRDYFTITRDISDKFIGVESNILSNKLNIVECKNESECLHYWYIERFDDGFYIRSADYPQFVIDLADGDKNVQVYKKIEGNVHQKWILSEIQQNDYSGVYNIVYSGDESKLISIENYVSEEVSVNKKNNLNLKEKISDYVKLDNATYISINFRVKNVVGGIKEVTTTTQYSEK